MNKIKKLVFGIGINDADYTVRKIIELPKVNGVRRKKVIWECPYYIKWCGMLKRCYSVKFLEKNLTYKNCTVCNEWHLFSNFKSWMETQDWENKHLDKDLLVCSNKVYSPKTCCFVTREINQFLTKSNNSRGSYPLGVSYMVKQKDRPSVRAKPFISMISKGGVSNFLGYYETPEQAHREWQKAKINQALEYCNEIDDIRIKEGLIRVADKIKYDYDSSLITEYF